MHGGAQIVGVVILMGVSLGTLPWKLRRGGRLAALKVQNGGSGCPVYIAFFCAALSGVMKCVEHKNLKAESCVRFFEMRVLMVNKTWLVH